MGRVGVDRRLIQSILDGGAGSRAGSSRLRDAAPHDGRSHRSRSAAGRSVPPLANTRKPSISSSTRSAAPPDDVNDELIQALLPFGERAVEPLLTLYEELGEEQGSDIAFLLAGLRVHDPRVLALLLDRLEFDAADGAFCLELYRRSRGAAGARNHAGRDSRGGSRAAPRSPACARGTGPARASPTSPNRSTFWPSIPSASCRPSMF